MSVQSVLATKLASFRKSPEGQSWMKNAKDLQVNSIVIRCVDPRLNRLLLELGLRVDDDVPISNAGPVFPAWDKANGCGEAAVLELFARNELVRKIYIVTHQLCKYCGGVQDGVPSNTESLHLHFYIEQRKHEIIMRIQQKYGMDYKLPEGEIEVLMAKELGLQARENILTYPVVQRRIKEKEGLEIYCLYVGLDPVEVLICSPDSQEYVPVGDESPLPAN